MNEYFFDGFGEDCPRPPQSGVTSFRAAKKYEKIAAWVHFFWLLFFGKQRKVIQGCQPEAILRQGRAGAEKPRDFKISRRIAPRDDK